MTGFVGGRLYAARMVNRHPLAFREGESRFVFAAWRDGSPGLVEMPEGGAELWRPRVHELMCPVVDCPSPDIGVVNRGRHRHGFTHRAGGDHGPESLNHVQGKALLVRWASAAYPEASVVEEHPSNAARERVADVMVTFPDGRRVALEVQYSALDVDKWQERHDSYRRQGILDVWFFGHDGPQASSVGGDGVELNAVQSAAAEHAPVLWLNPVAERVGYPVVRRWLAAGMTDMLQTVGTGQLRTEQLTALWIGEHRVHSEKLDPLADRAAAWDRAQVERDRLEQAAAARRAAEARRKAEEERRAAEEEAWFLERQQLLLDRWITTAEYAEALESMGGVWPRTLSEASAPRVRTQFPALMWQWLIWEHVIRPAVPDAEMTVAAAAAVLERELGKPGGGSRAARTMAAAFLDQLAMRGLLTSRYDRSSRSTKYFRSRRYFKNQPPPWASPLIAPIIDGPDPGRRRNPGRRSPADELRARMAQRAISSAVSAAGAAAAGTPSTPAIPATPIPPRCRFCRYELDPTLHQLGYHPNCASRLRQRR